MSGPWEEYQKAPAAAKMPWEEYAAPKQKVAPPPQETYDPAEGMNFAEKALVGAGGGLRRMYLGAKDLVPEAIGGGASEEERQELKDWDKSKEHLGNWGTAGEMLAEGLVTAPVGGPLAGAAGKVLVKAAPKLIPKIAQVGGKYLNLGTAGKAGVEGAVAGAVPIPLEGETRFGNAAAAGAGAAGTVGALIPAGKVLKAAGQYVLPTKGASQARAHGIFEKALGQEALEETGVAVRNATPSATGLPQTTAAMADSAKLGALERGARGRDTAGFAQHDKEVAKQVWDNLLSNTSTPQSAEQLATRATQIQQAGRNVLDTVRVDDGAKRVLKSELEQVLNSSEVALDPARKRAVSHALAALEVPNLSTLGLKEVHDRLAKLPPNKAVSSAMESLRYVGDSLTDDTFSYIDKAAGKVAGRSQEAAAARGVKETFESRGGIPKTQSVFSVDDALVPKIEAAPLRRAIAKEESRLNPTRKAGLEQVAEDLRRHELFKPSSDTGGSATDLSSVKGVGAKLAGVSPLWKLRPAVEYALGRSDRATQQVVDEALKDPKKFLALIEAKQLRNTPLTKVERVIRDTIVSSSARLGGASQGE